MPASVDTYLHQLVLISLELGHQNLESRIGSRIGSQIGSETTGRGGAGRQHVAGRRASFFGGRRESFVSVQRPVTAEIARVICWIQQGQTKVLGVVERSEWFLRDFNTTTHHNTSQHITTQGHSVDCRVALLRASGNPRTVQRSISSHNTIPSDGPYFV